MSYATLISIIVPIYNVDAYISRCLDSILQQTHPALEIILVDDGSPDRCGAICDEYAQKDARIKVIHQKNQGLSAARNTGIENASGEFIAFVDGDDWIATDMCEALLQASGKWKAEITVCQLNYVYQDGKNRIVSASPYCVSGHEATKMLLEGKHIQDYACGKLYLTKLFQQVRYPTGQVFEDISTTYRLFLKADRVAGIPEAKYFYLQRMGSIVRSEALKNEIDCYCAKWRRYLDLAERFPDSVPKMKVDIIESAVKVWGAVWEERDLAKKCYAQELSRIAKFMQKNYFQLKKQVCLGITGRLTMIFTCFNREWAFLGSNVLRRIYRWRHGET